MKLLLSFIVGLLYNFQFVPFAGKAARSVFKGVVEGLMHLVQGLLYLLLFGGGHVIPTFVIGVHTSAQEKGGQAGQQGG